MAKQKSIAWSEWYTPSYQRPESKWLPPIKRKGRLFQIEERQPLHGIFDPGPVRLGVKRYTVKEYRSVYGRKVKGQERRPRIRWQSRTGTTYKTEADALAAIENEVS